MGKRYQAIGIKQIIRLEWMQKAANLMLAGLEAPAIRRELHDFLSDRTGSGNEGVRSDNTRTFVVNNLMKIWVSPERELIPFRDASLAQLRTQPGAALAVHWAMISAAYPFWFQVARQVGRLLALQDLITQQQILGRLKEQYGDRETIARYGRYVLRSLVAWNVLVDSSTAGCYLKNDSGIPVDTGMAVLMLESALLASEESKGVLNVLSNSPAFFPFRLPVLSGATISRHSTRIEVLRYGMDEEMLKLAT